MLNILDHEAFMSAISQQVPRVYQSPITCSYTHVILGWEYGVVGTNYGYLHNPLGSPRLWKSASSAYRWIRENKEVI